MSRSARSLRRPPRRPLRRLARDLRSAVALCVAAALVTLGSLGAAGAAGAAGAPGAPGTAAGAPHAVRAPAPAGEGRTWVVHAVDSPDQRWVSEDTGTSIVVIAPGDTVEWRFDQAGQGHDLVSLDVRTPWPTDVAEYRDIGGEPFRYTFDEPGMYEFICSLHGPTMGGMVVVQESTGNQPPVASPDVAPSSGPAPLDVHFTANAIDPDGDDLALTWDFGFGGGTAHTDHAMFRYTEPGSYTATLTVSDGRGGVLEQEFPITVTDPDGDGDGEEPAVTATAHPASGPAPLNVTFGVHADSEHAHHATYLWELGDGTSAEGLSPEHTYTEPGDYEAVVTVVNGDEELGTATVEVSVTDGALPTIEARATPAHGEAPHEVAFATEVTTGGTFRAYSHGLTTTPDLTGTGTLVRQRGATSAALDVTGLQPGRSHLVHVHEQACDADLGGAHFRFDESQPFVEENEIWLPFTSDADGRSGLVEVAQPIRAGDRAVSIVIHDPDNPALRIGCVDLAPATAGLVYTWDFGDGTTGEGPDPDHTYAAPGHYAATVTVADASGQVAVSDTVTVVVHGAAGPGAVSGVVTSAGGAPVGGACVYLYDDAQAPSASYASCADAAGRYLVTGVGAGEYVAAVADPAGVFRTAWLDDPVGVAADAVTALDVELAGEPTGHLVGSVSAGGEPAGSVCVFAYAPEATEAAAYATCAGASGEYGLYGIEADGYDVAFFDPTGTHLTQWWTGQAGGAGTQDGAVPVRVPAGGGTAVADAVMDPVPTGTVAGRVTDTDGAPVAGVCVYLYDGETGPAAHGTCTGADGTWWVGDVAAGEYRVAFADHGGTFRTQWWDGTATGSAGYAGSSPVAVTAGTAVEGVDAVMAGQA